MTKNDPENKNIEMNDRAFWVDGNSSHNNKQVPAFKVVRSVTVVLGVKMFIWGAYK